MAKKMEKGIRIGCYKIVRPLMDGGMGRVYAVEHADLGVRRAMKVFAAGDPERREMFFDEARILAGLDSPRIVRIHDFAADDAAGVLYFTMDMVLSEDGRPRTLADPLYYGRSEQTVAGWLADLCEGLDYVHSRNVVHGDMKLENALVGRDGRAVLADFGLSRLLGGVPVGSAPFAPGGPSVVAGTIGYLPPETNGSNATPATDAWAMGVMVYRLLTGFWFDENERESSLSLLEDCELPWKSVLGRLLSGDPSGRIPAEGLSSLARTILDAAAVSRGSKSRFVRRPALAAASIALVASLGAGLWFAASPRPTPSAPPDAPAECGERGVLALPCPDPSARRWDDRESNGYAALDESIILANLDKFPPEVADALRRTLDRVISFYEYRIPRTPESTGCLDRWAGEQIALGNNAVANPAQLLLVAGEVYRQRTYLVQNGVFDAEVDRLAEMTREFLQFAAMHHCDPEWSCETVLGDVVLDDWRILERVWTGNQIFQANTPTWLLKTMMARCCLLKAKEIRNGRKLGEMSKYDANEWKRLFARAKEEAAAALRADTNRHASVRLMLMTSCDDSSLSMQMFGECLKFRFDDMRDWMAALYSLASPDGDAPDGAAEKLLDIALESSSADTWLPAFYVFGRWRVFARLGRRDGKVASADDLAWAYDDGEVKSKTLAVIRSFKDSGVLRDSPEMRRQTVIANFAAVALVCGDDALARELVARLPGHPEEFLHVMCAAVWPTTRLYRRLDALRAAIDEKGVL